MEASVPQHCQSLPQWKRIAIRAAAGGASAALVLAIIAAVALFYMNRRKAWNNSALRVVHAEAGSIVNLRPDQLDTGADPLASPPPGYTLDAAPPRHRNIFDRIAVEDARGVTPRAAHAGARPRKDLTPDQFMAQTVKDSVAISNKHDWDIVGTKPIPLGFQVEADIQNVTTSDITIPANLKVLSQERGTHALKETILKLDRDYLIPAQHTVAVSLDSSGLCAANYDPRKCFHDYFGNAEALVILNEGNRYEITIPMPTFVYQPSR